jgi:hypothetical protein
LGDRDLTVGVSYRPTSTYYGGRRVRVRVRADGRQ